MYEGVWFTKYIIAALRSYTFFRIVLKRGYACAIIVQTHCRHNEHLHKEVLKNNIQKMTAIRIKTMFPGCSRKGLCL